MEPTLLNIIPDFVVVGEFNEKVGPISKLILTSSGQPSDITEVFEVESFVLRVMSVELNTDSEDADFITTMELHENHLHAIIQHISLQDLYARGYVRRIVVAYLTQDSQNKILNYFMLFQGYFDKISRLLREKNCHLFESDIQKRLADLKYTAEIIQAQNDPLSQAISPTPIQINESIEELALLYKRLMDSERGDEEYEKPSDGSSSEAPHCDSQDPQQQKHDTTSWPIPFGYNPKVLSTLQHAESLTSDKSIRTLEEIAGPNWDLVVLELRNMLNNLRKSDLVLYLENQDLMAMAQPDSLLKLGYTATLNFNFKDCAWYHQVDYEKFFSSKNDYNQTTDEQEETPSGLKSDPSTPKNASPIGKNTKPVSEPTPPKISLIITETPKNSENGTDEPSKDSPSKDPHSLEFENGTSGECVESFGTLLWTYSLHNAGVGLLAVRDQGFSFTSHLVFSLLKGRPVIVLGVKDHKKEVQELVQALSVFVANNTSSLNTPKPQVIPWFSEPLQLSHLSHIKLVGMSKAYAIPLAVQKYVTIFDLEKKTLLGPMYRDGDFIGKILNEKKHWPNDGTYLAYVHSQLYEFAILACLYYHECCVGIPPHVQATPDPYSVSITAVNSGSSPRSSSQTLINSENPSARTFNNLNTLRGNGAKIVQTPLTSMSLNETSLKYAEREQIKHRQQQFLALQNQKSNNTKQAFFKRFHVKENDAEILQYFAEVIKMQQSTSLRGTKKSPVIKLDYSQVFTFENKRKK